MIKILMATLIMAPIITTAQHSIIPAPVQYENTNEQFVWDGAVDLQISSTNGDVWNYINRFRDDLYKKGIPLKNTSMIVDKSFRVNLLTDAQVELGSEGYNLEVTNNHINISANEAAGVFNALQTVKQLIPAGRKGKNNIVIPGCKIKDYPRFAWRGLMLDVSRHFFSVEDVKEFIDQMSEYKFNVLHWHLTDDEGWRIEIKSLPKLTEVGAWRVERDGRFGDNRAYPKEGEPASYGGFYTQEQVKDIINYAADRNISIIPEIDVPGHSMAVLAAYPELSTKKEPKFVNPGSKFAEWYGGGKFKMLIENTLNPADETVYEFLDKVFGEVAEMFPAEYIHMGGDECYKGYWEEDQQVQKFMEANGIQDTHELQSYFVKRVEKIISSKGKKLIGWDEILEGGLADGAAVMSWRGMDGGIEAAKMGHQVVMSPTTFAYLDYTQGDHSVENPIYADLSLKKTYSFEPVPENVDPKLILGGQGNLWTEVIPSMSYAFYMTYPRAFAIAETTWSPEERKDWNDFINRTESHFRRFGAKGKSISKAIYDPIIKTRMKDDQLIVELSNDIPDLDIYYTINNTFPVNFGKKYNGPIVIPEGDLSLKTQCYRMGKPVGRMLSIPREELLKRVGK